jgi:hypothetical protein
MALGFGFPASAEAGIIFFTDRVACLVALPLAAFRMRPIEAENAVLALAFERG